MSDNAFDGLVRHAASIVNRRDSLKAVGTAALVATVARPAVAQAGKAAKKAKKKCRRQVGQCRTFIDERCQAISNDQAETEECIELNSPCCDLFATCDALNVERFVECLSEASQP